MNPVRQTENPDINVGNKLEPQLKPTRGRYGVVIGWILPVVGAALAIATLSWLYQGIDLKRFLTAVEFNNGGFGP